MTPRSFSKKSRASQKYVSSSLKKNKTVLQIPDSPAPPLKETKVKSATDSCHFEIISNKGECSENDELNWFGGVAKSITEMMTMSDKVKYNIVKDPLLIPRPPKFANI
jgi:hypothetical protein